MKHFASQLMAVIVCALCVSSAQGALLGTYNFTSGETSVPTIANGTFTSFARQNVTSATVSGVFNSSAWNTAATQDKSEYVQFTIAPTSGSVSITDMAFRYMSSKTAGSHSGGPTSLTISVYAGVLGLGSGNNNTALASTTITLSANDSWSGSIPWDFADQSSSSGFTFRFYGSSAENANGELAFDDVTLNGSISAVPEPTHYALAGFGLIFVGGAAGRHFLARRRQSVQA